MAQTIPHGPKAKTPLGHLRAFGADSTGFLLRVASEYPRIAYFRLGPYRVYLVSDPDLIQDVLITQKDKIHKGKLDKQILSKFLGKGILTSDGDFHRQQRKLVQPAFHSKRIENYAEVMVEYTNRLMNAWGDGAAVNMEHAMTELTLHIVAKTLFDAEVTDGQTVEQVGEAIINLQHISNGEYKTGMSIPQWLPTPRNRKRGRAIVALNNLLLPIIEERRKSNEDKGDLLSMLLLAQDEQTGSSMSDQQVRDEAVTLFAAGHETTSNALTWTWYLLSQHPAVEATLHEELDRVLGGRAPSLADLKHLPYVEMVIKEAMRLYPPAWILNGRTPAEPITVDGYPIQPGNFIWISPYVMHHLPQYYPQPEQFQPERWTAEVEKALPRYAYLPFGGGPRVCIGNSFAMMEARLIVAAVAQRYRFSLAREQQIGLNPLITLSPKYGMQMYAHKRQTAAVRQTEAAALV